MILPFGKQNRKQAVAFLSERMVQYQTKPYPELLRLIDDPDTSIVKSDSGKEYQIEIGAFWDSKPGGLLRVNGSVDDGWLTASVTTKPFLQDFLVKPDGTLVTKEAQ